MGIEEQFDGHVGDWKKHCDTVSVSSNPNDYTNCEAYRQIAALGSDSLPLIRKVYGGSDDNAFFPILGWTTLVREIVGDEFQIPKEIRGRVHEIRDYTIRWLDENIERYVH
tara:strand:+ start:429 stop:761 length:333 start_codon:yes stop_codon:yes gene_type:complete